MSGPILATEAGITALNVGLDRIVQMHKDFPVVGPMADQQFAQQVFTPDEIAAMFILAVRRLAGLS